MGYKNTCKTFPTEFFDWQIHSKMSSFSTGSPRRKTQSKKLRSKKLFFDCVRKPDLGFSRKRPFSTDKSDCVRNSSSPFSTTSCNCAPRFIQQPGPKKKRVRVVVMADNNEASIKLSALLLFTSVGRRRRVPRRRPCFHALSLLLRAHLPLTPASAPVPAHPPLLTPPQS